jgi:hypothetical protein
MWIVRTGDGQEVLSALGGGVLAEASKATAKLAGTLQSGVVSARDSRGGLTWLPQEFPRLCP